MAGKRISPKIRGNLKVLAIAAIILAILLPIFFGWGNEVCLMSIIITVIVMVLLLAESIILDGPLSKEYDAHDIAKKMKKRGPDEPIRWKDYLLYGDISSVVPRMGVRKSCLLLFFIYATPAIALLFMGLYFQGWEAIYEPPALMLLFIILNSSLFVYLKKRTYVRALQILEKEKSEQEGGQ